MKYLIILVQSSLSVASAQPGMELQSFVKHARERVHADSTVLVSRLIKEGTTVDYLAPLANAYSNKQHLTDQYSRDGYYDNLSQTLSFTGDYKAVTECLQEENDVVDSTTAASIKQSIKAYQGGHLVDAKEIILQKAASEKVVMINEAHCKPLHRAFTYSLLTGFYKLGYKYLALEMLTNSLSRPINNLTVNTGYYTCEPLAGELIRKAIDIGFQLVPYEDTISTSNSRQRDSAQAMHLYEIVKKDPSAKILVHAGYGHIQKSKMGDDFVPMAYQFKNLSGIDPFCIDQTSMTEEGNNGFSGSYYNLLIKEFPAIYPSVLVKNDETINFYLDNNSYDLIIIHPRSIYSGRRASWYSLGNERNQVMVSSSIKNAFLIQGYYLNEWMENPVTKIVPVDQTYLQIRNNSFPLFLKKGKYKIISRDRNYKILNTSNLEVN